jgi:hypothetical protein
VPEPVLAGGQGHFVVQHKVVEACVRRAVRGRSKIRCMVQQICRRVRTELSSRVDMVVRQGRQVGGMKVQVSGSFITA